MLYAVRHPETGETRLLKKGGPYLGPRGGKWADPQHTRPWKDKKGQQNVYFRGTKPGDERRISTTDKEWDKHLFVSDDPKKAAMYGHQIEHVVFKEGARILREGTRDYRKVAGKKRQESLLEHSARVAAAAKKAGYHAVHFERQGDVGTAVLDESMVERDAGRHEERRPAEEKPGLSGLAKDDFDAYLQIAERDVASKDADHQKAMAVGSVVTGIHPDAGAQIVREVVKENPGIMEHTRYLPIAVRGRLKGDEGEVTKAHEAEERTEHPDKTCAEAHPDASHEAWEKEQRDAEKLNKTRLLLIYGKLYLVKAGPKGSGWTAIPHSAHGGFYRHRGARREYWYPSREHAKHASERHAELSKRHGSEATLATRRGKRSAAERSSASAKEHGKHARGSDRLVGPEKIKRGRKARYAERSHQADRPEKGTAEDRLTLLLTDPVSVKGDKEDDLTVHQIKFEVQGKNASMVLVGEEGTQSYDLRVEKRVARKNLTEFVNKLADSVRFREGVPEFPGMDNIWRVDITGEQSISTKFTGMAERTPEEKKAEAYERLDAKGEPTLQDLRSGLKGLGQPVRGTRDELLGRWQAFKKNLKQSDPGLQADLAGERPKEVKMAGGMQLVRTADGRILKAKRKTQ